MVCNAVKFLVVPFYRPFSGRSDVGLLRIQKIKMFQAKDMLNFQGFTKKQENGDFRALNRCISYTKNFHAYIKSGKKCVRIYVSQALYYVYAFDATKSTL